MTDQCPHEKTTCVTVYCDGVCVEEDWTICDDCGARLT
jgi:hypothetical protein